MSTIITVQSIAQSINNQETKTMIITSSIQANPSAQLILPHSDINPEAVIILEVDTNEYPQVDLTFIPAWYPPIMSHSKLYCQISLTGPGVGFGTAVQSKGRANNRPAMVKQSRLINQRIARAARVRRQKHSRLVAPKTYGRTPYQRREVRACRAFWTAFHESFTAAIGVALRPSSRMKKAIKPMPKPILRKKLLPVFERPIPIKGKAWTAPAACYHVPTGVQPLDDATLDIIEEIVGAVGITVTTHDNDDRLGYFDEHELTISFHTSLSDDHIGLIVLHELAHGMQLAFPELTMDNPLPEMSAWWATAKDKYSPEEQANEIFPYAVMFRPQLLIDAAIKANLYTPSIKEETSTTTPSVPSEPVVDADGPTSTPESKSMTNNNQAPVNTRRTAGKSKLHNKPMSVHYNHEVNAIFEPRTWTDEEIRQAIIKGRVIGKQAKSILVDKFGILPIPMKWFTHGVIIPTNSFDVQPSAAIGKELVRKLMNMGITIKTCQIIRSKDKELGFNAAELILAPGKIKLTKHTPAISLKTPEGKQPFPAASIADLGNMDILLDKVPFNLFLDGEKIELNNTNAFKEMSLHLADHIQALPLIDRIEVAGCMAKKPLVTDKTRKKQEWCELRIVPQNKRAKSYGEAVFTFLNENHICVHTSRERWVNNTLDMYGKKYDGSTIVALLIMGMTSERLVTQRQIDGWLSALSNLWVREDNYGAPLLYNDVLGYIIRNTHKTVQAGPCLSDDKQRYPHFSLENAQFNIGILSEFVKEGKPFMPDKYAMERVVFGEGAQAMMIDSFTFDEAMENLEGFRELAEKHGYTRVDNFIAMPHDVAKGLAKLLNRPAQAFGANFAESWDEKNYPLEPTALSIYINPDEPNAVVRGFKIRAAISNSLFGNGSGVSSCRPGFKRPIAVRKRISGFVHSIQIPEAFQRKLKAKTKNGEDWLTALIPDIEAKLKPTVGQYFKYGQDVLTIFDNSPEHKRTIIRMRDYNQEVKVVSYSVTRLGTSSTLQVTVEVQLEYADNAIKWRGPGVKATTRKENMMFSDPYINDNWEILFPYESLKGRLLQVFMYANAMHALGYECVYKKGKVYCTRGAEVIISDLSITNSHFEDWVKENTKLVTITRTVAKSHYETVLKCNGGYLPHVKVLGETDDDYGFNGESGGWVIEEQVQVLFGEVHLQCEVSTPRENTSVSSTLLEGLSMQYAQDLFINGTPLAEDLWNASAEYHEGIVAAVESAMEDNPAATVITQNDWEHLQFLTHNEKGQVLTGRDLMKRVEKYHPNGIVIQTMGEQKDVTSTYVNPTSFLKMGSFGTGGSATGVALDVVEMIHFMSNQPDGRIDGWDSLIHGFNNRIKTGIDVWLGKTKRGGIINSRSVLKRLGRTVKAEVNAKIQTSHDPYLEHHYFLDAEGNKLHIPTVVYHPNCDVTKLLGVKEGDIVLLKRTPMVMPVYCRVKISAKHGLIGYAVTLPEIWAAGNEGDADGDGCSSLYTELLYGYEEAYHRNESLFSLGGYYYVYGEHKDWPFADFVSVKDAWVKKLIVNDAALIPLAVREHLGAKIVAPGAILQIKTTDYLIDSSYKVSDHYRIRVGTVYGWCSIFSFKVAELVYSLFEDLFLLATAAPEDGGLGLDVDSARFLIMGVMQGDFTDLMAHDENGELMQQIQPRQEHMVNHIQAAVLAWRWGYEGMGLGGYSEEATAFFEAVANAVRSGQMAVVDLSYEDEKGDLVIASGMEGGPESGVVAIQNFLQTYFKELEDKNGDAVYLLAEAELLRSTYRRVESRGLNSVSKVDAGTVSEAMMWAALRRTTQGTKMVDSMTEMQEDFGGTSGFKVVRDQKLELRNPMLNKAMLTASYVHELVTTIDIKAEEAAAFGD